MENFEEILIANNCQRRDTISESTLDEIEEYAGFLLPSDYRLFLSTFFGFDGFIGEEYCQLWSAENVKIYNKNYSILEYLPLHLGIGSNGGGDLIAIQKLNQFEYRIVLTPFIVFDSHDNIEIGKSFADCLNKLGNGAKWTRD
jgi:hypothetical protein